MINIYNIILLLSGALCISAEIGHKLCHTYGCFESSEIHLYLTLDDDELCYADFKKELLVWESKVPTVFVRAEIYRQVVQYREMCRKDVHRWKPDTSVTKTKEPPDVVIYPRDEVVNDEENTLICFIYNFFPPKIKIRWTKNDEEVKKDNPFIKTISNSDGLFHTFSYLNFVPKDGDIYSCTVEHEALEEPKSRFWDVESDKKNSGPAVFCGLGLTFGLLAVAAGVFLFMKGNQHPSRPEN